MRSKVGYARESTKLKTQDQALEHQVERLKAAGADRVFVERISGGKDDRAGFATILQLIQDGQVEELIVTHLTRLGRSTIGIRKTIDLCRKYHTRLTILDTPVDLSTAAGRAFLGNQAVWAEYERELISERITNGWVYVRKLQRAVNPPFAYVVKDGRYCLDAEQVVDEMTRADVGRDIIQTFFQVRSLQGTVRTISLKYPHLLKGEGQVKGIPKSAAGLKEWLLNPVLQGHTRYKKRGENVVANRLGECPNPGNPILIYNTHSDQRLITDEEVRQVEQILSFNKFHHGFHQTTHDFPLSGLVYCGVCGSRAQVIGSTKLYAYRGYYQCQRYPLGQCQSKDAVRADVLEAAVIQALTEKRNAEAIADYLNAPDEAMESPEVLALQAQIEALRQLPPNPHIEGAIAAIEMDLQVARSQQQVQSQVDERLREIFLEVTSYPDFWEQIPPERKSGYYHELVKRIEISGGSITGVETWI